MSTGPGRHDGDETRRAAVGSGRIEVLERDLMTARVDALVNAANEHLEHGGGIARAIALAAGPELERESRAIGFVATGEAVATTAGRLPQRHVLHTPGPVWRGGRAGEPDRLAACHRAVVALAERLCCRSLALPAISTGIYGYPVELAAPVAVAAVAEALAEHPGVELVQFCLRGDRTTAVYRRALDHTADQPGPDR